MNRISNKFKWIIPLIVAAPLGFAEDSHPIDPPKPPPVVATPADPHTAVNPVNAVFEVARPDVMVAPGDKKMIDSTSNPPLTLDGKPGDVRLVVCVTSLIERERHRVPKIPLPPFDKWNKWLEEHKDSTHCSLDWMDAGGQWWHTEVNDVKLVDPQTIVGKGEFPAYGKDVYAVVLAPGRTDPRGQQVLRDDKIEPCEYRIIEAEARKYGRKDKYSGDPGTNGNGRENVGLGGPAYKPSQNSNTFISYLLKKAGVNYPAPVGAVGWDTEPHFPISTDAPEE